MSNYDPDAILADPDSHPIHKMYAEINIGIRDRGERWSKCMNCGQPYQLNENWDIEIICSQVCSDRYERYLNDEVLNDEY